MKLGAFAVALAVLALAAGAVALTARNGSQATPRGVVTTTDSSVPDQVTLPLLGSSDKVGDNQAGNAAGDGTGDQQAGDSEATNDEQAGDEAADGARDQEAGDNEAENEPDDQAGDDNGPND